MVSICIFAQQLIYAFEILQPPTHTNHNAAITRVWPFLYTLEKLI